MQHTSQLVNGLQPILQITSCSVMNVLECAHTLPAHAGVAMDDLVYICTKIAREMDANGLDKVFEAAQAATLAIEDGRPLLQRAIQLADEVG